MPGSRPTKPPPVIKQKRGVLARPDLLQFSESVLAGFNHDECAREFGLGMALKNIAVGSASQVEFSGSDDIVAEVAEKAGGQRVTSWSGRNLTRRR